jgi:hypothetical protein
MTPKYQDWRERHPRRDAVCRSFIAAQLGIKSTNKSDFARDTIDRWMVGYLSALLGWNEEPPPTPGAVPAEVITALDLEETR